MIRLRRPACPRRLATEGAEQTAALCKAAGASAAAAEGLRERDFHAAVYAHPEVRQTLWAMQHGKCAYCEKPLNEENAEVEHFRPKSAWQELASSKLSRPGYYWLAYTWSNLLLSCRGCNGSARKGTRFPLAPGSPRAKGPLDDLRAERPLLLDPAGDEDPAAVLRFRCHVPYAVEQHPAAETTIRVLELDRASLDAERERIYDLLCGLLAVLREHPAQEHRQRAGALLLEAALPSAPFSAMARDLLVVEELLPPSPAP